MAEKLLHSPKPFPMQLPQDFEKETLPFINNNEPTPKEEVITRLLESYDEENKRNVRSILNYLFAIPAKLFFKDGEKVRFA